MKNAFAFSTALAAALLSPALLADNPQLFRWSDAQGVIHYSDQPPREPVADLKTSDIPTFPAVDQAKVDKEQAALLAQAAALQELAQAEAQAQAAARLAAAQAAAQQAPVVIPAADDSYSPSPIYVHSAFVPRVYRSNLYLPRPVVRHTASVSRLSSSRPAMPVLSRP